MYDLAGSCGANDCLPGRKSVRVMDGKLFVSFTSAVVRNEIMMVKEGLIRALNEKVGKEVVKEMIIN